MWNKTDDDTAAWASIEDVSDSAARVDAQVRAFLGRVLAQRRSVEVAFGYVAALSPGTRANCWELAEAAGHEGWGRMQALLRTYAWSWKDLRAELPALAAGWLPDDEGDLIGPGIAIDETRAIFTPPRRPPGHRRLFHDRGQIRRINDRNCPRS